MSPPLNKWKTAGTGKALVSAQDCTVQAFDLGPQPAVLGKDEELCDFVPACSHGGT